VFCSKDQLQGWDGVGNESSVQPMRGVFRTLTSRHGITTAHAPHNPILGRQIATIHRLWCHQKSHHIHKPTKQPPFWEDPINTNNNSRTASTPPIKKYKVISSITLFAPHISLLNPQTCIPHLVYDIFTQKDPANIHSINVIPPPAPLSNPDDDDMLLTFFCVC
jgi:hypothetical protein